MSTPSREEQLRAHAAGASFRLVRLGEALAARQEKSGPNAGNVFPWHGSDDLDFHGTLAAIWVWGRARRLGGRRDFSSETAAAWSFVRTSWGRFVPGELGAGASDEAPYDCAMVLRAALADPSARSHEGPDAPAERAARLLSAHLADREGGGGREFQDPGFLAWSLAEYALAVEDRGMLAAARGFVDRAFGMKSPPPFAAEPAEQEGLFDFSSTTATRVLAIVAAEGATPFIGAWLRERVAPMVPREFVSRPLDENSWNALVAAALGRAYLVATDPVFLDAHRLLLAELERRADPNTGAIGRAPGFPDETAATFHFGLALDALVRPREGTA